MALLVLVLVLVLGDEGVGKEVDEEAAVRAARQERGKEEERESRMQAARASV